VATDSQPAQLRRFWRTSGHQLLHVDRIVPDAITHRAAVVQEARAFLTIEEVDPEVRPLLQIGPPQDERPNVLSQDEVWAAQRWLKDGLEPLRRKMRWNFAARMTYELDLHHGRMLWVRLKSCPECQRPFVYLIDRAIVLTGCPFRKARPEHIDDGARSGSEPTRYCRVFAGVADAKCSCSEIRKSSSMRRKC
jgi:hypothetical protein